MLKIIEGFLMELIQWHTDMSVKITEIDQQHKYLINLLNELFDAMIKGKADSIINEVVDSLIEYSNFHFSVEEKYFDDYEYPGAEHHKLAHVFFIDEVKNFKKEIGEGRKTVSVDVFNYLKDWLTDHIMVSDKKYSKYLIGKGVV